MNYIRSRVLNSVDRSLVMPVTHRHRVPIRSGIVSPQFVRFMRYVSFYKRHTNHTPIHHHSTSSVAWSFGSLHTTTQFYCS